MNEEETDEDAGDDKGRRFQRGGNEYRKWQSLIFKRVLVVD